MGKISKLIILFIHLILGGYLINIGIKFLKVPEYISVFDRWVVLVGGILVILGGINYLRLIWNRL